MTTAPQPAPQKTEKGTAGTKYVILKEDDNGNWGVVATDAKGPPDAAIKLLAKKTGKGRYVVVPMRNWRPKPATVTSETVVTLG